MGYPPVAAIIAPAAGSRHVARYRCSHKQSARFAIRAMQNERVSPCTTYKRVLPVLPAACPLDADFLRNAPSGDFFGLTPGRRHGLGPALPAAARSS